MWKEEVLGKLQVTALDMLANTEKTWALETERLCLWELCEVDLEGGLIYWGPRRIYEVKSENKGREGDEASRRFLKLDFRMAASRERLSASAVVVLDTPCSDVV
jgi:hypothetical protein